MEVAKPGQILAVVQVSRQDLLTDQVWEVGERGNRRPPEFGLCHKKGRTITV